MRYFSELFSIFTALFFVIIIPAVAMASDYEPSQGVTFREFVEARGCVLNEVKGKAGNVLYLTFASGCPAANAFTPIHSILVDDDNDPTTPDVWDSNH